MNKWGPVDVICCLFIVFLIVVILSLMFVFIFAPSEDNWCDMDYLIYEYNDKNIIFELDKINGFFEDDGVYYWEYKGIGYSAPENEVEFLGKG